MTSQFSAGGAPASPVCPRHPDRTSYVRCQRCERPVCPECRVEAPVGVQCTDCHASAVRSRPVRRTQFGAPIREDARPVVTYTVIAVCAAVYLLQLAPAYMGQAAGMLPDVTYWFSYAPVFTSEYPGAPFEPWRMITSAFLHSPQQAMHIVFNMMALWFIGRVLEPAVGRLRHAALLLISALGGSVAVLWLSQPAVPTVGASGAVFGLFGALFVLMRASGGQTGGIVALVGINMVVSFLVPQISWQGHLGGLVTGVLCALVIARAPRGPRRALWQGLGLAGIVVALLVLTAVGVPLVGTFSF